MSARAVMLPPRGSIGAGPIIAGTVARSAQLLELVAAHVPSATPTNPNAATVPPPRRVAALDATPWCVLRASLTGQEVLP